MFDVSHFSSEPELQEDDDLILYVGQVLRDALDTDIQLFAPRTRLIAVASVDDAWNVVMRMKCQLIIFDEAVVLPKNTGVLAAMRILDTPNKETPIKIVSLKDPAAAREAFKWQKDVEIFP